MNNLKVNKDNKVGQRLSQWGARAEVNTDNFLISKILPMQPTSTLVKDGKAVFGELRDSTTGELLAPVGKSLEFIPIELKEEWLVSELVGKSWEFKETIPYNNSNKSLPKEETVNGVQVKRVHSMEFYVLLLNDLVKGIDFPKTISFRSTSLRAGKVLYTQAYVLNPRQWLPPAGMVMSLSTKRVDGDNGSYMVMEVAPVEKTESSYVESAEKWYDLVRVGKAKVDDREEA